MAEINVPDVNRPWLDAFDGADNALRFAAGVLTVLAQSDVMDDPERDALEAALEYVRTAQEKVQVLNEIRQVQRATDRLAYVHGLCDGLKRDGHSAPPSSESSGDTP